MNALWINRIASVTLALCSSFLLQNVSAQQSVDFKTEAEVKSEIAKLNSNDDQTRYQSLYKLIDYASPELFRVGSVFFLTEHPDWVNAAADAVRKRSRDEKTLSYCLSHGNRLAKKWAIRNSPEGKLIPQLTELAISDPDNSVRIAALGKIPLPQQQKVRDLLRTKRQTDPYVLESMYKNEADFDGKLLELLKDPNEDIRKSCLLFIGGDGKVGLFPQPKHTFSIGIFSEIVRLTSAKNGSERAAAAYALDRVSAFDPTIAQAVFLRLAKDPDPDIPWRSAAALKNLGGQKASAGVSDTADLNSFLGLHSVRQTAYRRTKADLKNNMCTAIRAHIESLKQNHHEAQAAQLEKRLSLYLSDLGAQSNYQQIRQELDKANSSDVYVVSAYFSAFTDIGKKPWDRQVRVCDTGAPVSLMLLCGDQEGARWKVIVDPGVNLKSIILSGNGSERTSVSGNYASTTKIVRTDQKGQSLYVGYQESNPNEIQPSERLKAFSSYMNNQLPLTIQLRVDPFHGPASSSKPIVVGRESPEWKESLSYNLIERLYKEAIAEKNKDFRENFNLEFPVLLACPTSDGWYPNQDKYLGRSNHLGVVSKTKLTGVDNNADFVGLAIAPRTQQTFYASRKQVYSLDAQGVAKSILPAEMSKIFESDVVRGIAFDSKRNRLIIPSSKIVLAYSPVTKKWSTLSFADGAKNIVTYNASDDSLYSRDEDYVCRLNPETGALIQYGYLPMGESTFLKQVFAQGNYIVLISEPYRAPKGLQQLATVVDKRDGNILYQDAFNFVPIK